MPVNVLAKPSQIMAAQQLPPICTSRISGPQWAASPYSLLRQSNARVCEIFPKCGANRLERFNVWVGDVDGRVCTEPGTHGGVRAVSVCLPMRAFSWAHCGALCTDAGPWQRKPSACPRVVLLAQTPILLPARPTGCAQHALRPAQPVLQPPCWWCWPCWPLPGGAA